MKAMEPSGRPGEAPLGTNDAARMAELIDAVNRATQSAVGAAEPASAEADSQPLARMCFRVGELGLLFPWNDGREVVSPPPLSRVPNTVSWMRGLANMRGELVPVIDAAAAFGVPRQAGAPTYLLILGQGESAVGLLIDGLPRLLQVNAAERLPAPPGTPRLLADSVIAAYEHAGRVWLDVDLDALFDTLARDIALA